MFFVRQFTVRKHERGLLFRNGDFVRFLAPAVYRFFDPHRTIDIERFDLTEPAFEHRLVDYLVRWQPEATEDLFVRVETKSHEVAIIYRNGHPWTIVAPQRRALFWKGVTHIKAERIDIENGLGLLPALVMGLAAELQSNPRSAFRQAISLHEIPEAHVGLLYVDGRLVCELSPGLHGFWKVGRNVEVEIVDCRLRTLELPEQALLTSDQVSLRVAIDASYRFVDARLAATRIERPPEFLSRELRHALREAVSAYSLDTVLKDRSELESEVVTRVREELVGSGIELRDVELHDIALTREVELMLGKVTEAERAAQVDAIRRRERASTARSLLDAARVLEEHPTALRLKELETLERITDRVGNLSAYGGLDGLLRGLARVKL